MPLVDIHSEDVDANVTNGSFDVDISNQPIQVEIVR